MMLSFIYCLLLFDLPAYETILLDSVPVSISLDAFHLYGRLTFLWNKVKLC